jgi:hypothetical protein
MVVAAMTTAVVVLTGVTIVATAEVMEEEEATTIEGMIAVTTEAMTEIVRITNATELATTDATGLPIPDLLQDVCVPVLTAFNHRQVTMTTGADQFGCTFCLDQLINNSPFLCHLLYFPARDFFGACNITSKSGLTLLILQTQ